MQIDSNTFVLKRGVTDGLPNPSHMSSEFCALVPRAALCHVKVSACRVMSLS